ncbi:MAG: class I SAM-dependent methyltransferase, partial [SAR324 cluster bacterium]|nr:class I SAM-dependent methyltransferase [SAR324 cluster bacterium]
MTYQLPSTVDKAKYVSHKFNEIALKYDRFNDLITFGMHRYWKRFVARQTGLREGERCLDLCCGTGDIAELFIKATDGKSKVHCIDPNKKMIKFGKEKLKNYKDISWKIGKA